MIGWFLPERRPDQYVLAGDNNLTLFRRQGRRQGRRLAVVRQVEGGLADELPAELVRDMLRVETGVVFTPSHFIFHVFEFERLPWQQRGCRELVEWKLQKTFPENIELYDHRFFRIGSTRVFSVLARQALLEKTEELFARLNVPLTFVGSSTVSLLNRRRGATPDLLVEIDRSVISLLFLKNGRPAYVRRSKTASPAEYAAEIAKTVQYVVGNQGLQPRRFQVVVCSGAVPDLARETELTQLGLTALPPLQTVDWLQACP
jgi:hypothetical protein